MQDCPTPPLTTPTAAASLAGGDTPSAPTASVAQTAAATASRAGIAAEESTES